ncbi:MAG: UTP--glucose-1-phosphate uridylyltransferase [Bacteriovoracaceae bacterium]
MKVTKAVIPIAGKGTRFLPATKQIAKEIIPIINKPMIHYVVEEARAAGIKELIFITSSGKEEVENYFDRNLELEAFLKASGKEKEFELIKNIGSMVDIITIRQKEQLGLGHAILQAEALIGNEPFAVLLGDDIILSQIAVTKQLMDISKSLDDSPVIGVMEVPKEETKKYGIVDGLFIKNSERTLKMNQMVEKPDPSRAPTNLATPGRYILNKEIFQYLKQIPRGAGGEYQLTDAINMMAAKRDVYAHIFEGDRFDTGSVMGYLDATVEFALRDPELKQDMLKILQSKLTKYS